MLTREIIQPNVVFPVTGSEISRERLPVLLWDPLIQFPAIFSGFLCPYCALESKDNYLKATTIWNDGTTKKRNPRIIFDISYPILLVARRYRCFVDSDHCFVATHKSIMEHLERHKSIAFTLTVKSGYFNSLSEAVCSMSDRGMSFNRIEKVIQSIYRGMGRMPSYRNDEYQARYPSAHFLEEMFLNEFQSREDQYISSIKKTTADWLSTDHTFKSVMNIGYPSKVDGKWVNVFNALFCVLNEKGQILKWRFTKSTKSEETEKLFDELSCRLKKQKKKIKAIYVDNCCQIRKKMRTFLEDENLNVKLDLFHAINRFLITVPKRLQGRKKIAREYRNVFRAIGDYGKTRKRDTPSPEILLRNLERFERKWKGFRQNKRLVLNKKSLRALQNIKIHMKEGCLSHIPPGCGTNRNERLHRKLKKIAGRSKLGVGLAYALFTRAFHRINEEIKEQSSNVKEIETNIDENFGFFKNDSASSLQATSPSTSETNEDKANSSICKIITSRAEVANMIYNNVSRSGFAELENREFHQSYFVFTPSNKLDNMTDSNSELLDQRANSMGLQRHFTEKRWRLFFYICSISVVKLYANM